MKTQVSSRRVFLKQAGTMIAPLCFAWPLHAAVRAALEPVQFGVCADPHKDVMHDADERLRGFVDAARRGRADFIVQLGDFCRPYEKNRSFMNVWQAFPGRRYHTLGNHEVDGGFTWQQVLDFWGMERRYHSFDQGGWHFVVLDGNEKNPGKPAPGYPRYIGAAQLAWLEEDLRKTNAPTLVFSHQSLEDPDGVENRQDVRSILERANTVAGWRKVGACLSGHHHIDYQTEIAGILYIQINSMSYSWLGSQYERVRYSPEVDKAFPFIKYTAPYKDALFALCHLDPQGRFTIQGIRSEFVGPSPWELGMPEQKGTSRDRERLAPRISDRHLRLATATAR